MIAMPCMLCLPGLQAYTSYLQPITSHKLWNDVRVSPLLRIKPRRMLPSIWWQLMPKRENQSKLPEESLCKPPTPQLPGLTAQAYDDIEHFETSYVVKLFKFHPLAPTQVG